MAETPSSRCEFLHIIGNKIRIPTQIVSLIFRTAVRNKFAKYSFAIFSGHGRNVIGMSILTSDDFCRNFVSLNRSSVGKVQSNDSALRTTFMVDNPIDYSYKSISLDNNTSLVNKIIDPHFFVEGSHIKSHAWCSVDHEVTTLHCSWTCSWIVNSEFDKRAMSLILENSEDGVASKPHSWSVCLTKVGIE